MNDHWYIHDDASSYLKYRGSSIADRIQALRATMFEGITSSSDILLDFGCGTGGIAQKLPASEIIGVEIGSEASEEAKNKGFKSRVESFRY